MTRRFRILLAALVASQVAYSRLPERRLIGATRAIVGLLLTTSVVEAVGAKGGRRGAGPIGAAGAIGFAVELAGVRTGRPFGHYSYSGKLGLRFGGVPLPAAAAWAMMSRPAWVVAGLLTPRRRLSRAVLAAGALTAWDAYLDPRMAREGYWTWPGGGRYEGIPASNFLGWFVTGLGVFAVWSALEADAPDAGDDGALAIYVWTWVGEGFANAALWRRPVTAAVGGAAMGAFAAPALVARSRARRSH